MLFFKSCPRCGGDLREEADSFGRYAACIQCGHQLSEAELGALRLRAAVRRAPLPARSGGTPGGVPAVAGKRR